MIKIQTNPPMLTDTERITTEPHIELSSDNQEAEKILKTNNTDIWPRSEVSQKEKATKSENLQPLCKLDVLKPENSPTQKNSSRLTDALELKTYMNNSSHQNYRINADNEEYVQIFHGLDSIVSAYDSLMRINQQISVYIPPGSKNELKVSKSCIQVIALENGSKNDSCSCLLKKIMQYEEKELLHLENESIPSIRYFTSFGSVQKLISIYFSVCDMKEFRIEILSQPYEKELFLVKGEIIQNRKPDDYNLSQLLAIYDHLESSIWKILNKYLLSMQDDLEPVVLSLIGKESNRSMKTTIAFIEEVLTSFNQNSSTLIPWSSESALILCVISKRMIPSSIKQINNYFRRQDLSRLSNRNREKEDKCMKIRNQKLKQYKSCDQMKYSKATRQPDNHQSIRYLAAENFVLKPMPDRLTEIATNDTQSQIILSNNVLQPTNQNKDWKKHAMKNDKNISLRDIGSLHSGLIKSKNNDWMKKTHMNDYSQLRGGGEENKEAEEETMNNTSNSDILRISEKISAYKKKIQSEVEHEMDPDLYIEPNGKYANSGHTDLNPEPFELAFQIQKLMLNFDSKLKVLLLTGKAGIGKSIICKRLQRTILIRSDSLSDELEEREWLPIYIDLSNFKNSLFSSSRPLTEFLIQELLLTEEEVILLQEDKANKLLPDLLFIFDNYDEIYKSQKKISHTSSFWQETNLIKGWEHAKIIIASRDEAVSCIARKDFFFRVSDKDEEKIGPPLRSFLEIELQSFNDFQITSYLRKYVVAHFSKNLFKDNELSSLYSIDSWALVKKYEDLIDQHGLREVVRVPLLLMMSIVILNDKILEDELENLAQIEDIKAKQIVYNKSQVSLELPTRLNSYKIYGLYIDRIISSAMKKAATLLHAHNEEQKEDLDFDSLAKIIKRKLQIHALNSSDYLCPQLIEPKLEELELSNLKIDLHSIIRLPCTSNDKVSHAFMHKSLYDFFIATKIVKELTQNYNNDENDVIKCTKKIFFNQMLLSDGSIPTLILQLLVDAVNDHTITTDLLI